MKTPAWIARLFLPITVGSRWRWFTIDPFEDEDGFTRAFHAVTVIAKRRGFVQFQRESPGMFEIESISAIGFRLFYEPIEPPKQP